jgi:hypothetical protein
MVISFKFQTIWTREINLSKSSQESITRLNDLRRWMIFAAEWSAQPNDLRSWTIYAAERST